MSKPKTIERFAAMCEILYGMEQELGIDGLSYHEKRVVQVASSACDKELEFLSADVMKLCRERYNMSRATFFRSLQSLLETGYVTKSPINSSGYYRLSLK